MGEPPAVSNEPIVLLVTGGDPALPVRLPTGLPAGSVVVAADSGLDRVAAAGLHAHHLIGDLDSARADLVERAQRAGTEVHRFAADKDATDLELAVERIAAEVAPAAGIDRLLVVGAGGGRLDHLLADLLALSASGTAHLEVTAHLGASTVTIVRAGRPRTIAGTVGEVLSLLPLHGPATGVTTSGVRWPLVDAVLVAGTTRGVSNELLAPDARVAVDEGVIAAVQPGVPAASVAPRTTPYDPTPRAGGTP